MFGFLFSREPAEIEKEREQTDCHLLPILSLTTELFSTLNLFVFTHCLLFSLPLTQLTHVYIFMQYFPEALFLNPPHPAILAQFVFHTAHREGQERTWNKLLLWPVVRLLIGAEQISKCHYVGLEILKWSDRLQIERVGQNTKEVQTSHTDTSDGCCATVLLLWAIY